MVGERERPDIAEEEAKATYCSRCGKELTLPESIKRGMGKVCAIRAGVYDGGKVLISSIKEFPTLSEGMALVESTYLLKGRDGSVQTNLTHLAVWKEFGGWDWLDTDNAEVIALNILLQFTSIRSAIKLHIKFAQDKLAMLPSSGGYFTAAEVRGWIKGMK